MEIEARDRTLTAYPCGVVAGQEFRLARDLEYPGEHGSPLKLPAGWIVRVSRGALSEPNVVWFEDPTGRLFLIPDNQLDALELLSTSRLRRPTVWLLYAAISVAGFMLIAFLVSASGDRKWYRDLKWVVPLTILGFFVERSMNRREPPNPLS